MLAGQPSVALRSAIESDLPKIAKVHRQAYSKSHFTSLLPEKTLENYYRHFFVNNTEILVAVNNDVHGSWPESIVGFAVFGFNIPQLIGSFKRQNRFEILQAAIGHPLVSGRKLVDQFLTRLSASSDQQPCDYLLVSIAVGQQNKGVGKMLLSALTDHAQNAAEKMVGLYVKTNNVNAINVYCAHGFKIKALIYDQYYMEKVLTS